MQYEVVNNIIRYETCEIDNDFQQRNVFQGNLVSFERVGCVYFVIIV